ncbi:MAG TPA: hypothetical protein ENH31_02945 [Nitrospirae bacterium]|nr:hypothetical protein [Nitrospirota bacterium]HDK81510.1 hypothetical protein [Nitrospirota bacterium]
MFHINNMRVVNAFLCFLLLTFLGYDHAVAFQAEVSPAGIYPGDAFIIKVTGLDAGQAPEAFLGKKPFYFSDCGEGCSLAIGSIGLETKPGTRAVKLIVGGSKASINLHVKKADFPTIHLTLPDSKVFLGPEDLKRAQTEAERLKAVWDGISDKLWEGKFILPLDNKTSTAFGVKRVMNKKKVSIHRGVDIKGKKGDKIKAFNRGRVVLADDLFFGGNTLVLDHGQGIFSIYMHMSKFNVRPGDIVEKGEIVGLVGATGRASGPHLHFSTKVRNISTNPLSLLELAL